MAGTSPAPYGRSPSLHSSSYLPKAEANFLKDYKCCGLTLDSLHELLQHFEENHAQPSHQITHRASVSSQSGGARRPSTGMSVGETTRGFSGYDQQRSQQPVRAATSTPSVQQTKDGFSRTQLSTVQDVDNLDDMELDDSAGLFAPMPPQHQLQANQSNSGFNMNPTSSGNVPAQHAFRTSTPTTPSTGQPFAQFGNPTVSSVNTPALNTNDMQQGHMSPNQSIPGTPGELDPNFGTDFLSGGINFGALPPGDNSMMNFDYSLAFGLENNLGDMTIDDPAKRLFSKQGGMNNTNQLQFGMKNGQMSMDGDLAKRLREQQLVGGLGGPIVGFPEPEQKPFKCPVIGCEKSYKNQNGLKYHKQVKFSTHTRRPVQYANTFQHGHQNQQLQENEDGTYSIVDPTTSIPYPGTIGMEKEKPYRCETCGKRYKNLNGLKYHRQHSPPCNPELKQHLNPLAGLTGNLHGLNPNANIAGAGLAGMPESSMY
jgi:transcription factor SFP1